MKIMTFTVFILTGLIFPLVANGANYSVSWQGTQREFHHGDVSGKVPLQQFSGTSNLYAVGPVAGLDGEITVIDSNFYISRIRHGEIKTDSDLTTVAGFLVWSEAPEWKPPITLGESADTHPQLENLIETLAVKEGIDTSKPFPFIVEGMVQSVAYHILAPRTSDSAGSDPRHSSKKVSLTNAPVKILGFFSKEHGGVFTHMGSRAHLHVLENNGHTGHVEKISVGPEVLVLFPQ